MCAGGGVAGGAVARMRMSSCIPPRSPVDIPGMPTHGEAKVRYNIMQIWPWNLQVSKIRTIKLPSEIPRGIPIYRETIPGRLITCKFREIAQCVQYTLGEGAPLHHWARAADPPSTSSMIKATRFFCEEPPVKYSPMERFRVICSTCALTLFFERTSDALNSTMLKPTCRRPAALKECPTGFIGLCLCLSRHMTPRWPG